MSSYNKYGNYGGGGRGGDQSGRRGPNPNSDYRRGSHGPGGGYYGHHGGSTGYRGGGGPPAGGGHVFVHKPKLEEDYRNKNIHKFKRMHGSNVMSPRTERLVAQQSRQFKKDVNIYQM